MVRVRVRDSVRRIEKEPFYNLSHAICDSNNGTDNKRRYYRLRGSGSTVVNMTSKVNGTMEILTPCRSETPKNIKNPSWTE